MQFQIFSCWLMTPNPVIFKVSIVFVLLSIDCIQMLQQTISTFFVIHEKEPVGIVDSVFINYLDNIQTNIKHNPHLAAITRFTDLVWVLTAPALSIDSSPCTYPSLLTKPCIALCWLVGRSFAVMRIKLIINVIKDF